MLSHPNSVLQLLILFPNCLNHTFCDFNVVTASVVLIVPQHRYFWVQLMWVPKLPSQPLPGFGLQQVLHTLLSLLSLLKRYQNFFIFFSLFSIIKLVFTIQKRNHEQKPWFPIKVISGPGNRLTILMSIWADIMTVTDLLWSAPNVFTFLAKPLPASCTLSSAPSVQ